MFQHYTVMKNEAVGALECEGSDKIYIDATLGGGGHSELIAQKISLKGRLICFDVDDDAIEAAQKRLKPYQNVEIIKDSYVNIPEHLERLGIKEITGGVLFDLGASYHQLTTAERGFSFLKDAPLDMRFNKEGEKTAGAGAKSAFTAADIINTYREEELVKIFSEYGEERFSKRIAKAILANRPIHTTLQLAELIKRSTPRINSKIHCATRVFQALRIEVNQELLNFKNTLNKVVTLLAADAIISIISFHSLEDRLTKSILRDFSKSCRCEKTDAVCKCHGAVLELITKKPIIASEEEIGENPPSRSAKLRIARKI